MESIPIVNISSLDTGTERCLDAVLGQKVQKRQEALAELGDALHRVGFVAIQGHSIPSELIASVREEVATLFARPHSEKLKLTVTPNNYRGYIPMGFFTPNGKVQEADQYEAYKLHQEISASDRIVRACPLYGPNKWPKKSVALKDVVMEYWQECDRVTKVLLTALSEHLRLDRRLILDSLTKPLTNMTLLHYPPSTIADDQLGIHPHKDTDLLTILAGDPVGGLFVRPRDSEKWLEATGPDDALIVNVGDMLEIWSGGYFMSTPHKVVSPKGQHRYSFPYFAVPRYDVHLESLVSHDIEIENSFTHRTLHVGDVSAKIWQSNWPDAEAVDECYDPYIKG